MPRFFISHRETDGAIAESAVALLLESFQIEIEDVFCSSVPGHSLKFGASIEQQIRDDIRDGDVLLALLTKDSLRSTWVLFELGAAWGLKRLAIPILGPGVAYRDLPTTLSSYPCISIDEPEQKVRARIEDALKQIAADIGLTRKTGGRQVNAVDRLMATLQKWVTVFSDKSVQQQSVCPTDYEIYKSTQGGFVFKSILEPVHCICPACYAKEKMYSVLQGDLARSEYLRCSVCKTAYHLRNA